MDTEIVLPALDAAFESFLSRIPETYACEVASGGYVIFSGLMILKG